MGFTLQWGLEVILVLAFALVPLWFTTAGCGNEHIFRYFIMIMKNEFKTFGLCFCAGNAAQLCCYFNFPYKPNHCCGDASLLITEETLSPTTQPTVCVVPSTSPWHLLCSMNNNCSSVHLTFGPWCLCGLPSHISESDTVTPSDWPVRETHVFQVLQLKLMRQIKVL